TRAAVFIDAPRAVGIPAALTLFTSLFLSLLAFARRWPKSAPGPDAVARLVAIAEEWLRWRFLWGGPSRGGRERPNHPQKGTSHHRVARGAHCHARPRGRILRVPDSFGVEGAS